MNYRSTLKAHPHVSRIMLGSAQFGQNYGIANKTGKIFEEEAFEILRCAHEEQIKNLDTASAYGESEAVIGKFMEIHGDYFKIVSKLPPLEQYVNESLEGFLRSTLKRVRTKKIDGYLIHRFDDFLKYDALWEHLVGFKERGFVSKIGFSLYTPGELEILLNRKVDFDIVQIPYSIFDRRFEEYFDALKERNVEIDARSVFLQGAVFLPGSSLPTYLQSLGGPLRALQRISSEHNISINALCINFVLINARVDKVVIGVDGLNHFKENINAVESIDQVRNICSQLKDLKIDEEGVLLPYKWAEH